MHTGASSGATSATGPRHDGTKREASAPQRATTPQRGALYDRFGPTALVTGASDGIGRAFAIALAQQGFDLVLVARRKDRLAALADTLSRDHGSSVQVVATDLARPAATQVLLDATAGRPIGLVVAAAGYGSVGLFLDRPLDQEAAMVDLNCRSVVEMAHGFGQRMADAGRGGLVLFGSLVGFSGAPRSATYAATKGFVQSFAEGLAVELRPRGVSVMSVAPGPVDSGFADRAGMRLAFSQSPEAVAAGALAALGRTTTVRPGALSKLVGWSLGMLPRRGRVRVLGALMEGMTAVPATPVPGRPPRGRA